MPTAMYGSMPKGYKHRADYRSGAHPGKKPVPRPAPKQSLCTRYIIGGCYAAVKLASSTAADSARVRAAAPPHQPGIELRRR